MGITLKSIDGSPAEVARRKQMQAHKDRLTKGVRPFSKDRLYLVSRDEAAKGAFAVLDKLQQEDPHLAMAATAILFAMWCRRLGLDPHETYQLGKKLIEPQAFHQKGNIHVEVLRDFAGARMNGDGRVEER